MIPGWNRPYESIYTVRPDGTTAAGRMAFSGMLGPGAAPGTPDVFMRGTGTPYSGTPALSTAIGGLLTPGLVPDIARQSAEASAGRGIGGSPAGASTAVRMSEQNWLQRLALANSLLSGEESRKLPYNITPYQAALLAHQREVLAAQERIARMNNRRTGGGSLSPGGGGGRGSIYPFANMNYDGGFDGGYGSAGGSVFGGGGGAGIPETLDDVYDWLGFGNFGEVLGDSSSGFPEFGGAGYGETTPDFGSLTPDMPEFDWDF